jgi:hypothetical protein
MRSLTAALLASLSAVTVFAVTTEVVRALATATSKMSDNAGPTWQVGTIRGSYGDVGADEAKSQGGQSPAWVSRFYGDRVTQIGTVCNSTWPETAQVNRLRVTLHYEGLGEEPVQVTVGATSSLTEKQSSQKTTDWSCPNQTPGWDSTCTILLYKPAVGTTGEGAQQAGSLTQQLTHAPREGTPTDERSYRWDQTPQPSGYNDQSGAMSNHTWNIVPSDPSTHYVTVTSKCEVKFKITTATEITVEQADSKAKAKLEVTF